MSSNVLTLNPFFTPTQISGCSLWLDAADASTVGLSGGNITTWADKSGNNRNATSQGTGAAYVNNGLVFTGTQTLLGSNATYLHNSTNGTWSMFATFTATNTSIGNPRILNYQGTPNSVAQFLYIEGGRFNSYIYAGPVQLTGGVVSLNTPYITSLVNSTSNAILFANGTSNGSVAHGANTTISNSTYWVGGFDSTSDRFYGTLNEILMYSNDVTTSQRQQVEGYLAWKWGLVGSLPSDHPYKTTPVLTNLSLPPQFRNTGAIPLGPSTSPFSFFNPTNITSCALWLDGFDPNGTGVLPANNASLSTWVDKSSFRNNGTATGVTGIFQTNSFNTSYPSIFFNVSKYGGTYPTNTGTTVTGFYVGRASSSNGSFSRFISLSRPGVNDFSDPTATPMLVTSSDGNKTFRTERSGSLSVDYTTTTLANVIANVIFDGTNCLFYANGTLVATNASSGSFNLTQYGIGAGTQDTGQLIGNVAEIILFNSAVNTTQRQQVEGYLAWKWGLVASLPASHPYKNAVPGLPVPVLPPSRQLANRSFQPTSFSGCALWLDGADPLATGSPPAIGATVSTWVDKSGNTKNATAGGTPTYLSGGGITLNGSNAYYTNTSFAFNLSQRSIFFVIKMNSYTAFGGVLPFIPNPSTGADDNTQTGMSVELNTTFLRFWANNGGYQSDVTATLSNVNLFNDNMSGTAGSSFLNGTRATANTANFTQGTTSGYAIGARWIGAINTTYSFPGNVYEVIYYSSPLSVSQRQNIEGYLAWKWGLVGNLPATHPYKRFPPPPS